MGRGSGLSTWSSDISKNTTPHKFFPTFFESVCAVRNLCVCVSSVGGGSACGCVCVSELNVIKTYARFR